MANLTLKPLSEEHNSLIIELTQFLNPEMSREILQERQTEMFSFQNYVCLGCFEGDSLIGLSSGWITVRLYSGKQLEIDNVIIHPDVQSKGYGGEFMELLEEWATAQKCETVELNAYVQNHRAHKFYYKLGYKILGFHFQKRIVDL